MSETFTIYPEYNKSALSREEKAVLRSIMRDLKAGYSFGRDFVNVPFPFFDYVLHLSPDGRLIRWQHFGSSANKATLHDLEWILTVIFKLSPSEFLREYLRNDQSKLA